MCSSFANHEGMVNSSPTSRFLFIAETALLLLVRQSADEIRQLAWIVREAPTAAAWSGPL
jgi:hypothetical protein